MSKINLIRKSDVYFDFFEPMVKEKPEPPLVNDQMHHGEVYVYRNQILLHDDYRWYKANVNDIQDIKTIIPRKQIIIRFGYFGIVLSCKDISRLLAIRDYLNLSQKYFLKKRSRNMKPRMLMGNKYQNILHKSSDEDFNGDLDKISN